MNFQFITMPLFDIIERINSPIPPNWIINNYLTLEGQLFEITINPIDGKPSGRVVI